ncbi:hypothetical protein UFOVP355_56 [uncultured Caudovirales phage]|uniref:Uncharacterized protein n=1 Tax=uncultured Caudovirales phage TaxID=2100421 RepID=A0A6J5NJ82_9CAUD|nr:hypothetical protein UFOVP355_56 [uncultured Caudovirales phage]CAB4156958.1 hypothetical protein UFOVP677_56 [uncultured Caudovirales phage]
MPKPPVDELMEAILKAAKAAGMSVGQSEIKTAIGAVTKSSGRRAPRTPAKGAAAAKPARPAPRITAKTATGGAGRKPPKPPKAGAAAPAPKPRGPKKPSGGAKKMTRLEKREINKAKHYAEREKWLAETSEKSRIAKEQKSAANKAAWAVHQEEMYQRRLAGLAKKNKKKGTK